MKTKSPEVIVGKVVGRTLGNYMYYRLLRRMGAPKYIAYIAMGINQRLYEIVKPISDDEIKSATTELIEKYGRR